MAAESLIVVLGSVLVLGMRHGIDHDHIAAITDLTALQKAPARAMRLGLVYAAGHATVLLALGAGAVLIGLRFPEGWDVWREKIVGATLIALGLSVVAGMVAHRHAAADHVHIPSRAGVLLAVYRRLATWARRVYGGTTVNTRSRGEVPAFIMGMLHGLGAETPSQLLLLVVAAGMGAGAGLLCVGSFVVGLFITNTVMCAVMVGLYRRRSLRKRLAFALSGVSALYSVWVGVFYLMGAGWKLPDLS